MQRRDYNPEHDKPSRPTRCTVAIVDRPPFRIKLRLPSSSSASLTRASQTPNARLNHACALGVSSGPDIEANQAAMARFVELRTAHVAVTSPLNVTVPRTRSSDPASTSAHARDTAAVESSVAERKADDPDNLASALRALAVATCQADAEPRMVRPRVDRGRR